jgi:hypothetical protein
VFTHALFEGAGWPPTGWSHDRASWTVEAKFVVNDFGLRNRMAIITETPGQPTFEKRIYAQYAYIMALLQYASTHAKEMQAVVKAADDETVARVIAGAEAGTLKNYLDGEYRSRGKIDVLGYRSNVAEYLPGTSVRGTRAGDASGAPELLRGLDDLTMPVGTRESTVPRSYLIPATMPELVEKLQAHNIRVTALARPVTAEGEQFTIERMRKMNRGGYEMTVLDGSFAPMTKQFPAGSYQVDMAQPMANAAFYYLEPQARDGFVGWGVLDAALRALGAERGGVAYPVFKMRREVR